MSPADRALLQALTREVQRLAEAVKTLAGNTDYPQMERKAALVAEGIADANLTWEMETE